MQQNYMQKNLKKTIALTSIILSNLTPLAGVIFFSWNIASLIFIYWLESIIIWYFNILKIRKAGGTEKEGIKIFTKEVKNFSKKELMVLYSVHFAGLICITFFILIEFIGFPSTSFLSLLLVFISLMFNHACSYVLEFIGEEKYKFI